MPPSINIKFFRCHLLFVITNLQASQNLKGSKINFVNNDQKPIFLQFLALKRLLVYY